MLAELVVFVPTAPFTLLGDFQLSHAALQLVLEQPGSPLQTIYLQGRVIQFADAGPQLYVSEPEFLTKLAYVLLLG